MDFYKRHFGKRLQSILDEQGLSQAWLAEELDVKSSTVSRWVNGHDLPNDERAAAIAGKLGLTLEELAGSLPEVKPRTTLARDRRVIRQIIEEPQKTPLSTLVRLLEEFQGLSRVRRATILATLFDDPQLALLAQRAAKTPKTL